ncbi:MAG: RtcB family protein [Lachnospiraceae bacterium]|nr:RtcB family protein [Lachnospiraceae bacterium]
MITIAGTCTTALICCREDLEGASIERYALDQIRLLCDTEALRGSRIRVMPDVHPGKTGPVGLTLTVGDAVLPGLVGVDIGCGVDMVRLGRYRNDFQKLDTVIRENVPVGSRIRKTPHHEAETADLGALRCEKHIRREKALLSLGTLGGGNHFIELDRSGDGEVYLAVHSGSRHLGKEVADHYMEKGARRLKKQGLAVPYEMTYLTEEEKDDYLHDLEIVQRYAALNRRIIIREICKAMKWKEEEWISCIHNYIDADGAQPVLRKGAISAKQGERVIIPVNMKDGILLGRGLGNADWNESAPHGSGRIASREDVTKSHTVSEFKAAMKGIYSSCIGAGTLDEAPFAYRGIAYLQEAVRDTVRIEDRLTPMYSYKGGKDN